MKILLNKEQISLLPLLNKKILNLNNDRHPYDDLNELEKDHVPSYQNQQTLKNTLNKIESPLLAVIEHAMEESPLEKSPWNDVSLRLIQLLDPSLEISN